MRTSRIASLVLGALTAGLAGALLASGPASADIGISAQPLAGESVTIAGSKLTVVKPERMLIPVTLPKFTIAASPDGTATKPSGTVKFSWKLCKYPTVQGDKASACFTPGTPAAPNGVGTEVSIPVAFTKAGDAWQAPAVRVPFDPKDFANAGVGYYLRPTAIVTSVKASGTESVVGLAELSMNPAASGIEIATSFTRPVGVQGISFTTDKETYGPDDTINWTASLPAVDFSFATSAAPSETQRQVALFRCDEAAAQNQGVVYETNVANLEYTYAGPNLLTCSGAGVDSERAATPLGPIPPKTLQGSIPVRSLIVGTIAPGQSRTLHLSIATVGTLKQIGADAGRSEVLVWNAYAAPATRAVTISVPANGVRVEGQAQAGAGDGLLAGQTASGSTSASPAGALANAGVDLSRAPLRGSNGTATVGSQKYSVKVSKSPKRGKTMTVTGTVTPAPTGAVSMALVYTLEGKEVVVRSKTFDPAASKSSVKWKLKKSSPKGKYTVYLSYLPTDPAASGVTVARTVTVR